MLGEGYADAAAGWEVGCPSYSTYGSGVHAPQVELIARMNPKLILLGFDKDDAGERAAEQAFESCGHLCDLARVDWQEYKDPAEVPLQRRREILMRPNQNLRLDAEPWDKVVTTIREMHLEETNE